MKRREFLYVTPVLFSGLWSFKHYNGQENSRAFQPIPEPHFPSRLYQFVWRNWELANTGRMAQVIQTNEQNVLDLGYSMGLPKKPELTPDQLRRIYITVIRQNWHLLPESQIIKLLGWDRDRFDFTLKEDDFLNIKLGMKKPECPEILYQTPSPREREQATLIRNIIRQELGAVIEEPREELFHFVKELSKRQYFFLRDRSSSASAEEIDLTRGWSLMLPRQELLARAARHFQEYLQTAMGAQVELTTDNSAAKKRILLMADAERMALQEEFQVYVSDEEVRISGRHEQGALQGLYWLQDQMERREGPFIAKGTTGQGAVWDPCYVYSYFALYGDPLIEADIDPFPEALLEKLGRLGITGVWMQAVLNTLAPSKRFPEFGARWETRLANLNALVQRAKQFGIKVYLYINEPRAMPEAFFRKHPEIKGSSSPSVPGLHAMCTSVPVVRQWISESLAHVMQQVPDLGGWFTITMSENFTNCFSHGSAWGRNAPVAKDCRRCSERKSWEVIGELIQTFQNGVKGTASQPELIIWDWGWGDELSANLIPLLPKDVRYLSVSEWDLPLRRGGVNTEVGEYSISAVGPGPRALKNWSRARRHGIRPMAKVQFNNTWEISAVPYIPVLQLILQHCENLSKASITGIQASWTLGGYPSPNLAAAKSYYFEPRQSDDEILDNIGRQRYGKAAAPSMIEGWKHFSEAFREFPYGVFIYIIPTQHGPANLLRFEPTGYRGSMILFPQDDFRGWSGRYPPEVVSQQFTKVAARWRVGLKAFRSGLEKVAEAKKALAETDLAIAETCFNHFQSTANQVEFYLLRDKLKEAESEQKKQILDKMGSIAKHEIELAKDQFRVARRHSMIAYEASNHYYYTPLDLVEKILNCRQIIDQAIPDYKI